MNHLNSAQVVVERRPLGAQPFEATSPPALHAVSLPISWARHKRKDHLCGQFDFRVAISDRYGHNFLAIEFASGFIEIPASGPCPGLLKIDSKLIRATLFHPHHCQRIGRGTLERRQSES